MQRKFGWKPDALDFRDFRYAIKRSSIAQVLPNIIDFRSLCAPVRDQGSTSACTGFALRGLYGFLKKPFEPSPLFIYYNERVIENDAKLDDGAEIRNGIKTLADKGAAPEKLWPFIAANVTKKPSKQAYANATKHQSLVYARVNNSDIDSIKTCLATTNPVVFGFACYESLQTKIVERTGIVPMPRPTENRIGGHAALLVGYNNKMQCFIFQNSWGSKWGEKGFGYLPYAYLTDTNLADDFWTITKVE